MISMTAGSIRRNKRNHSENGVHVVSFLFTQRTIVGNNFVDTLEILCEVFRFNGYFCYIIRFNQFLLFLI